MTSSHCFFFQILSLEQTCEEWWVYGVQMRSYQYLFITTKSDTQWHVVAKTLLKRLKCSIKCSNRLILLAWLKIGNSDALMTFICPADTRGDHVFLIMRCKCRKLENTFPSWMPQVPLCSANSNKVVCVMAHCTSDVLPQQNKIDTNINLKTASPFCSFEKTWGTWKLSGSKAKPFEAPSIDSLYMNNTGCSVVY